MQTIIVAFTIEDEPCTSLCTSAGRTMSYLGKEIANQVPKPYRGINGTCVWKNEVAAPGQPAQKTNTSAHCRLYACMTWFILHTKSCPVTMTSIVPLGLPCWTSSVATLCWTCWNGSDFGKQVKVNTEGMITRVRDILTISLSTIVWAPEKLWPSQVSVEFGL